VARDTSHMRVNRGELYLAAAAAMKTRNLFFTHALSCIISGGIIGLKMS
jgi:hypothetical protein